MDAFGRVLVGSARNGDIDKQSTNVVSTSILSTSLIPTWDLNFLSKNANWAYTDHGVFQNASAEIAGLFNHRVPIPRHHQLANSLEELFQNVTVSLLTFTAFQTTARSQFGQSKVLVHYPTYAPTYVYAVKTLWLAYGIAILFSTVGVIVGMCCILSISASFSNDFSTILRAAKQADLSTELEESHGDGKDPPPKYLAEATVVFEGGIWISGKKQRPSLPAKHATGEQKGKF